MSERNTMPISPREERAVSFGGTAGRVDVENPIIAAARAVRQALIGVGRAAISWWHCHRALRELDSLTDRDLRDLKVSRADFSYMAWSEARRAADVAGAAGAPSLRIGIAAIAVASALVAALVLVLR